MKILLSRFAQTYGGAERSFVTNARALKLCRQDVLAITNLAEIDNSLKSHDIPARRVRLLSGKIMSNKFVFLLIGIPVFSAQLLTYLIGFRPDLIYAQSRIDQVFWTKTKWLHKLPVFWKDPSDLAWTFEVEPESLYGKLHISALAHCDGLYVLSEKYLDRLAKSLPENSSLPGNLVVAPSGIIPADYKIKARSPSSPLQIASVGRLHEKKGFAALLEAVATLKNQNFRLIIAGDGDEFDNLLKLRDKLGLQKKVVFAGAVSSATDLLNSSDVFVSAAEVEPWGLAIAEARLFGKAIVATPTEGAVAQLKDGKTGIIAKNFSAESIAEAISSLLKNPKQIAILGRNTAKDCADVDFVRTMRGQILPAIARAIKESKV